MGKFKWADYRKCALIWVESNTFFKIISEFLSEEYHYSSSLRRHCRNTTKLFFVSGLRTRRHTWRHFKKKDHVTQSSLTAITDKCMGTRPKIQIFKWHIKKKRRRKGKWFLIYLQAFCISITFSGCKYSNLIWSQRSNSTLIGHFKITKIYFLVFSDAIPID